MQPKGKKAIFVVLGVLALLVIALFFIATSGGGSGSGSDTESPSAPTQAGDAAQSTELKMDEEFDVASSPNVPTVTEVRQSLTDRGLGESALTVDFDITGNYSAATIIDQDSDEKYPSYVVQYLTEEGNPWLIYINDGNHYALPLFQIGDGSGVPIIVSETDYVTGYNGANNTFKNSVPNVDDYIVKKVSVIDKATLDGLTAEELGKL